MYSVPITEAQVVVFALGAVDHDEVDFGVRGQLHAAIRAGRRGRLTLQVKVGRCQQRRAHQLVENGIEVFGVVFGFQRYDGIFQLRVERRCFGLILVRHGFLLTLILSC